MSRTIGGGRRISAAQGKAEHVPMTEHTADLRREEIDRIAETLKRARLVMFRVGTGYLNDPEEVAHALYDAGLRTSEWAAGKALDAARRAEARSQDTATARIAAELEQAEMDASEEVQKWGALDSNKRVWRDGALWALNRWRAVLSGETRTGGET